MRQVSPVRLHKSQPPLHLLGLISFVRAGADLKLTNQSKVVELKLPSQNKQHPVPRLLIALRDSARGQLASLVQVLFNSADDALFEMAERSNDSADRDQFFGVMRTIRLHRQQIVDEFLEAFEEGFQMLFNERLKTDADKPHKDGELSLIQNDELERSVAISGIVSKVTSQFSIPIMQLTKRIDSICDQNKVTERLNPLGPQRLSESFIDATSCLDLELKVQVILLKLFERFVMEGLGPVFASANETLIEAGILPNLKAQAPAVNPGRASYAPNSGGMSGSYSGPSAPSAATGHYQSGDVSAAGGSQNVVMTGADFQGIQNLLAAVRATGFAGGSTPPVASSGDGISTEQLLNILQHVQTKQLAQANGQAIPTKVDVMAALGNTSEVAVKGLGQADADVVSFVGMLFDYILNDKNLAIPMKALIARMQIPIIRLVILDKSFLERSNHPARLLLNELSSAGIGWSSAVELKRDDLYNTIESIVTRTIDEFVTDVSVFEEHLAELRSYVAKDTRRQAVVEKRVRETESGRAKAATARTDVDAKLKTLCANITNPLGIDFLCSLWRRVMIFHHVNEGSESDYYRSVEQAAIRLADFLAGLSTVSDFRPLLKTIDEQLLKINISPSERERWHTELSSQITNPSPASREDDDVLTDLDAIAAELDEIMNVNTVAQNPGSSSAPGTILDIEFLDDGQNSELIDELELVVAKDEPVQPRLTPEPQQAKEPAATTAALSESIKQIRALREGMWVDFIDNEGDRLRCKLSAIIQPGNKYIFVNRRGMKVSERLSVELADALEQRNLKIIEESQVFDRALQTVIGNLRQMHRSPMQET
ncbi:MAG: DUF1631 domain-containing protein [Proteobacteria bacterium]|nr:DUF1631 domain-containing protein [Pseudomonadota bacterium]